MKNIIVINDHQKFRTPLSFRISEYGYSVIPVTDIIELNNIPAYNPAIIIIDDLPLTTGRQ